MLLLYKPAGLTSHQAVQIARRSLGVRRIGHSGTLDPLAEGVLPCLVGSATRLVQYMHLWSKTYVGVVELGEETPTGDREGHTARAAPAPLPPREVLASVAKRLTGTYLQQPPAYSAKKIGGVPAHRIARQGFAPNLAPARVTIHALRIQPLAGGRLAFAARVSSGTYLRSLARDVGRLLGTGAHLGYLRRTGVGPLRSRAAVLLPEHGTLPAIGGHLVPVEDIPLPLPTVEVSPRGRLAFVRGQSLPAHGDGPAPPGAARVLDRAGRLIGIGEIGPEGQLRPRAVLAPSPSPEASGEGESYWRLATPGEPW